jgi:hypothetical protein
MKHFHSLLLPILVIFLSTLTLSTIAAQKTDSVIATETVTSNERESLDSHLITASGDVVQMVTFSQRVVRSSKDNVKNRRRSHEKLLDVEDECTDEPS